MFGTPRQKQAVDYFLNSGYSPYESVGIVANLMAESGTELDPLAHNTNENARGLAQWTPNGQRQQAVFGAIEDLGYDPMSFTGQLEGINWEMQGPEARARGKLAGAQSPGHAAALVDQYYERSSGEHRNKRIGYANQLYEAVFGEVPTDYVPGPGPDAQAALLSPVGQNSGALDDPSQEILPDNLDYDGALAEAEEEAGGGFDLSRMLMGLGVSLSQMDQGQAPDLSGLFQQKENARERAARRLQERRAAITFAKALPNTADMAVIKQGLMSGAFTPDTAMKAVEAKKERAAQRLLQEDSQRHQIRLQANQHGYDMLSQQARQQFDREMKEREIEVTQYWNEKEHEFKERGLEFDKQRFVAEDLARQETIAISRLRYEQDAKTSDANVRYNERMAALREKEEQGRNDRAIADRDYQNARAAAEDAYRQEKLRLEERGLLDAARNAALDRDHRANVQRATAEYQDRIATIQEQNADINAQKLGLDREARTMRGKAGQQYVADLFAAVGDQETAERIMSEDPARFADGNIIDNYTQAATRIYAGKEKAITSMREFELLQKIKEEYGDKSEEFLTYKRMVAGASTEINMGESKDLLLLKHNLGHIANDITPMISKERGNQKVYTTMRNTLLRDGLRTGAVNEILFTYNKIADELGLPAVAQPDGMTTPQQVFEAFTNSVVPHLRAEGSGTQSDTETRMLYNAFANIGKSPEANLRILDYMQAVSERNVRYGHFVNTYLLDAKNSGKTVVDAQAEWQRLANTGDLQAGPRTFYGDTTGASDNMSSAQIREHIRMGWLKPGDVFLTALPSAEQVEGEPPRYIMMDVGSPRFEEYLYSREDTEIPGFRIAQ